MLDTADPRHFLGMRELSVAEQRYQAVRAVLADARTVGLPKKANDSSQAAVRFRSQIGCRWRPRAEAR
jgi:hypothetical protein